MEWVRRLFCKHEWKTHSFSDVRCAKCRKVKYSPSMASELINKDCAKMVDAGLWDGGEVAMRKAMHNVKVVGEIEQ